MKLVRTEKLGSFDDYRVCESPTPAPQAGQVLIQVFACGVGYADALVALGAYQVKPPVPYTPGNEEAGTIVDVGEGVNRLAVGDRVMAYVRGGFAEFAISAAESTLKIPSALTFGAAAALRINYLTALHALRDRAQIQAGERLLVFGASGGVGLATVQLGAMLGAEVIAVAFTPQKRAIALQHGAKAALDREADQWRDRLRELAPNGIDVVFDPACGPLMETAFRSLRWCGRYLIVGFAGGDIPKLPVNLPLLKGAALVGVDVRQYMLERQANEAREALEELMGWAAEGRINPLVGKVFALSEHRQALDFALSGQGSGKTIVQIIPEPKS